MIITKISQVLERCACKSRVIYSLFRLYYLDLVRREVSLAKINKDDHILCVGGGKCPFTAILLREYTDAKITVIDNCRECVRASREFLKREGVEGIDVKCCDGIDIRCNDYSVIHIAMQVSPLDMVLSRIVEQAVKETRVLVRNPKDILSSMYSVKNSLVSVKTANVSHGPFVNAKSTSMYNLVPGEAI